MYRKTRLEFLHGERLSPEISDWETDGADYLALKQDYKKTRESGCLRWCVYGRPVPKTATRVAALTPPPSI